MLIFQDTDPQTGEVIYGYAKDRYINHGDKGVVDDLEQTLADNIDNYDYVLVYKEDEAFEAALDAVVARSASDVKICYSYRD